MRDVKQLAAALAGMGRKGDTILAHITPEEADLLHRSTDGGSINPVTGLPEFYDDSGIGGDTAGHGENEGMGMDGGGFGGGQPDDGSPPLGGGEWASFGEWADALSSGYGVPGGHSNAPSSDPNANYKGSEPMMVEPYNPSFMGRIGRGAVNTLAGLLGFNVQGVRNTTTGTPGTAVGWSPAGLGLGLTSLATGVPGLSNFAQPTHMIDKGYDISERFDPLGRDGTMMAKR